MYRNGLIVAALAGILILLGALTGIQTVRLTHIRNKLEAEQDNLVNQLRDTRNEIEALKRTFNSTVPTGGTAATVPDNVRQSSLPENQTAPEAAPYFNAVQLLLKKKEEERSLRQLDTFMEDKAFTRLYGELGLTLSHVDGYRAELSKGDRVYITVTPGEKGAGYRMVARGDAPITVGGPDAVATAYLRQQTERLDKTFRDLPVRMSNFRATRNEPRIRELTSSRSVTVTPVEQTPDRLSFSIKSATGGRIVTAGLDLRTGEFLVDTTRYRTLNQFQNALVTHLESRSRTLDPEIIAKKQTEALRQMLADPGFTSYLDARNLHPSDSPREDTDFVYFDLLAADGTRVGSFAIHKSDGEIWLMDEDDVPISSLRRIEDNGDLSRRQDKNGPRAHSGAPSAGVPVALARYSLASGVSPAGTSPAGAAARTDTKRSPGVTTFLLAGKHEDRTDTIMIVQADGHAGTIRMLSVPRDLFYKGNRINVTYGLYGPRQFVHDIQTITGVQIDHYVVIDMYAFIDVVNILGGIDVRLEEELLDPTYRVKENGHWTTLYYPPGLHHLDGVEALRIARSRHTSSDFDRASRQQLVLEAIRHKIGELSVGDAGKLYSLMLKTIEYVDTDLTPVQAVAYFTQYSDAGRIQHNGLSTDNVLFSTYSRLYFAGKSEDEVGDDFDKGAWILLPVGDDWSVIPRYVSAVLSGNERQREAILRVTAGSEQYPQAVQ